MSQFAICLEKIGKQYKIGRLRSNGSILHKNSRLLPSYDLTTVLRQPQQDDFIWALKEVSFEVKPNEVVGIIGRNGSGKSTLLKILSRVTEPTTGRAEIKGRSASLLEVGTGFHPELTGRENVYLNGSILGMKRREISAKFDEIVDFSEIEKFIDTPIKHYSSGMAVRLAFAVAAHLEPDILMVDEVLAVGDLKFQRKCIDKMKDVERQGRTVLFVTHQMTAVRRLCASCIWLEDGLVKMFGPTTHVVSAYESASLVRSVPPELDRGPTQFLSWEIDNSPNGNPHWLETMGSVIMKLKVRVECQLRNGLHGLALWSSDDELMWGSATHNLNLDPGIYEFIYSLENLPLVPGNYRWHASLWEGAKVIDNWYAVPELVIATPLLTQQSDQWAGVLNIPCDFTVQKIR